MAQENHMNLKETELRLGLPGTDESEFMGCSAKNNKRASPESVDDSESKANSAAKSAEHETSSASKAQIVGWPPVRSYRKNNFQPKKEESETGMYVKVSMDGAPYLRKVDLKVYNGYPELLKGLENMFKVSIGEYSEREGYKGSEFAPAYEDEDGDLMLVGDVPWENILVQYVNVILQETQNRESIRSQRPRLCRMKPQQLEVEHFLENKNLTTDCVIEEP